MAKYILKRIGLAMVVLFLIVSLAFMVLRLMPGTPYDDIVELSDEAKAALNARYHLDKPIPVQYFYFIKGVILENDWGTSTVIRPGVGVFDVLIERIPASIKVNIISLIISIPLGFFFGAVAAMFRNRAPDNIISFGVILFISVPAFVFAALMQYYLAGQWGWLPMIYNITGSPWEQAVSLVMPVVCLCLHPVATLCRRLRGELIETLTSDYMLLARTKGMKESQAVVHHAIRNSLVTVIGSVVRLFTNILGGSMVIESIFAIPGVGGTMVEAIRVYDYSLAIGALMFYSFLSLATSIIVDVSYVIIDPRIRLTGSRRAGSKKRYRGQ